MFLLLGLSVWTGCGQKPQETPAETPSAPSSDANSADSNDVSRLDLKSETSPEGVMDRFLATFFSGKDSEAWALLTPKAQNATENSFTAMASDTVKWNITKKTIAGDLAYIFVNVSDLTETGDRSNEELIFVLRCTQSRWGVAGFNAGKMAVDYEQTAVETYEAPETGAVESAELPDAGKPKQIAQGEADTPLQ